MIARTPIKINIIVDNDSWILKYAQQLQTWCLMNHHSATIYREHAEIVDANISFFLGCIHIAPTAVLRRSDVNLVVHESDLPQGRGFAPMSWQILEGKSTIPVCLVEAAEGEVDSGKIYGRSVINLDGHELSEEWRHLQGQETIALCQKFIKQYPVLDKEEQTGAPTYYARRHPADSELDVTKSIEEQFDLLRIVDNSDYPAFFEYRGYRYDLSIKKHQAIENMPRYIFASIKPWQIRQFKKSVDQLSGQWTLITKKEELTPKLIEDIKPRYVFFGHWSWIVPEKIIRETECVCFHMTDVPFGRGGSPLQNLISRGINETKLTALKMVKELDAGPVYDKQPLLLTGSAQDIFERMTPIIFDMIRNIVHQEPEPVPQEGEPVYFKRRTPDMSELPEDGELGKLYDHIRMLDAKTYPAAYIDHGSFRVFLRTAEWKDENRLKVEAEIQMFKSEDEND